MLHTKRSYRGMVTAPHHLAAQAGLSILHEGGNAIEAMIAAAATIAVTYPHMNGLGGDCFFLIGEPGRGPVAIEAAGRAAGGASIDWYRHRGHDAVPTRGPHAALTVAGAVSGWQAAHAISHQRYGGRFPVSRLLEAARDYARDGIAVTRSLHQNTKQKLSELQDVPGFADTYLDHGAPLVEGSRLKQLRLAETLDRLAHAGLDDFYRGEIAQSISADLEALGSPLRLEDFERHEARLIKPLSVQVAGHAVHNLPPPTQGLASLMVLALYERLAITAAEGFDFIHGLVEATKSAFEVRDRCITDPDYMTEDVERFLSDRFLDDLASTISKDKASPWPRPSSHSDTVWMGAADGEGRCVSFIQSIYWEFGSGVVLPGTGITWQNRGASFSLNPTHQNRLDLGRRPFHTIQPAMAVLDDGRIMAYGTMGGEGQPQTQAAVFTRHVLHDQELQTSITAPRWLLGRTWGAETTSLKIENRFESSLIDRLRFAGHDVEVVGDYEDMMGHAGAIVRHADGLIEGAADPRSDGCVASW